MKEKDWRVNLNVGQVCERMKGGLGPMSESLYQTNTTSTALPEIQAIPTTDHVPKPRVDTNRKTKVQLKASPALKSGKRGQELGERFKSLISTSFPRVLGRKGVETSQSALQQEEQGVESRWRMRQWRSNRCVMMQWR